MWETSKAAGEICKRPARNGEQSASGQCQFTPTAPGTSDDPSHRLQRLSDLRIGEAGVVERIDLEGKLRDYVTRFGFINGVVTKVIRRVPLGNLRVYRVGQSDIALRAETAREIMVVRELE